MVVCYVNYIIIFVIIVYYEEFKIYYLFIINRFQNSDIIYL